jgi:hypothetical protein
MQNKFYVFHQENNETKMTNLKKEHSVETQTQQQQDQPLAPSTDIVS